MKAGYFLVEALCGLLLITIVVGCVMQATAQLYHVYVSSAHLLRLTQVVRTYAEQYWNDAEHPSVIDDQYCISVEHQEFHARVTMGMWNDLPQPSVVLVTGQCIDANAMSPVTIIAPYQLFGITS